MRRTSCFAALRHRAGAALLFIGVALLGCEKTESTQRGPDGTSQIQLKKPSSAAALAELNRIPPPEDPADADSPPATEIFVNVQVLRDVSATEFSRLMQALSTWVAPVEGCDFCHNPDKLESDEKYPKVVARKMLEMTRRINTDWKAHVGDTGVTCWTCHRGQAVPSGDWFSGMGPNDAAKGFMGNRVGQNRPSATAVGSSLPDDPLTMYLTEANEVRVQGTRPLAGENPNRIKKTEWTYSLMLYMSDSLGVNCTYCHNTRALARWEESTPQRVTAWHGIRMVRMLNNDYLKPVEALLPTHRMGPLGDGPKVGCATCHKGTFKPLNGVSPLTDYPLLAGVGKVPAGTPTPPEPAASAPAGKVVSDAGSTTAKR